MEGLNLMEAFFRDLKGPNNVLKLKLYLGHGGREPYVCWKRVPRLTDLHAQGAVWEMG